MFMSVAQACKKAAPRIFAHLGPRVFVNSRTKVPMSDVHVHFDCTGSRKLGAATLALQEVSFN